MKKYWKIGMTSLMVGVMLASSMSAQADYKIQTTNNWNLSQEKQNNFQIPGKNKDEKAYAEGEVIVMYNDNGTSVNTFGVNGLGNDMKIEKTYSFEVPSEKTDAKVSAQSTSKKKSVRVSLIRSKKYTTKQLIQKLSARNDIRYVEPNYKYHLMDSDYSGFQWGNNNIGQNAGTAGVDVNPEIIQAAASNDEKEKVVAVVDTGMNYKHPDLAGVVWNNPYSENKLKGKHGYDIVNNDDDPLDDHGHGSHCSGIIAGVSGDNSGISGVANHKNIKIMPIKVLDEYGSCYGFETVGAYNYIYRAQQAGVNIVAINNSWGLSGYVDEYSDFEGPESKIFAELVDIVGERGALSVCAAGNDAADNDDSGYYTFPSNIDSPYIVSVAACNEDGDLADFSCYGKKNVDIAAPGADILSSVSYDVFNPGIYTDTKRSQVCSTFESYESKTTQDVSAYRVDVKGGVRSTITVDSNEYFGKETSGKSLHWSIKNAKQDSQYVMYVPYDKPSGSGTPYVSAMVRLEDKNKIGDGDIAWMYGGSVILVVDGIAEEGKKPNLNNFGLVNGAMAGNYWTHAYSESYVDVEEDGQRYIGFVLQTASDGDYDLYIDNVGVSNAVNDTAVFEQYDYYNGTSMAAPYVTGSVASVAQAYPELSALERKSVLLGCSKKTEGLKGKVATDGMLDFSLISQPRMSVSDIVLNDEENIEIQGAYLEGVEVTINNAKVEPMSVAKDLIVINGKDYRNKRIHIVLKKGEDEYTQDCYFAKGDELEKTDRINGFMPEDNDIISDGSTMYCVDEYGCLYYAKKNVIGEMVDFSWMSTACCEFTTDCLGEKGHTWLNSTLSVNSNMICCNGKVWTVIHADAGFESMNALVYGSSDAVQMGWENETVLPEELEGLKGLTIAAYNGQIYALGGFDEKAGTFSKDVYCYNVSSDKEESWKKVASLPEGRAFAKGMQVGNRLAITLGAKDTNGTCPSNLIFDGTSWKVAKASLQADANKTYEYGDEKDKDNKKKLAYFDANTSMIKDAIIYFGLNADNLSSIYTYNVVKDTYITTDCVVGNELKKNKSVRAVAMGDEFCVLVPNTDPDTKMPGTDVYGYPVQSAWITTTTVYVMSGMQQVEVKTWLPSDQITLTPMPMEGYYVESFTVNGNEVKPNADKEFVYQALASKNPEGLNASVSYKPYVECIITAETMEIPIGGKETILYSVMPDEAIESKLKWESDNSLVKVSQKGVVTVSEKAKVGDTAMIKVTATDRGTVSSMIRITVVDKLPVPSVGKKHTSGGVTYKVTKSSEKYGTVTCVGLKDKTAEKVVVPAKVVINGYTFKVTKISDKAFKGAKNLKSLTIGENVTSIGKEVCKSCSKLKAVYLKSSKIKTIGKGAFNGIHKSATIKVPKKKVSTYKKRLSKAGCKATVKAK